MLITHRLLAPRSRIGTATPAFPPYAYTLWTGITLYFMKHAGYKHCDHQTDFEENQLNHSTVDNNVDKKAAQEQKKYIHIFREKLNSGIINVILTMMEDNKNDCYSGHCPNTMFRPENPLLSSRDSSLLCSWNWNRT